MFLVLHGLRCLIITDLFLDSARYNVLCRVSAVHSSVVNVINLCLCHSVCSWVIVFVYSLKSVPLICILYYLSVQPRQADRHFHRGTRVGPWTRASHQSCQFIMCWVIIQLSLSA